MRDLRPAAGHRHRRDGCNAGGLRHGFAAWLGIDVVGDLLDDLVLAVYEAVTDVVDDACTDELDSAGSLRLTAHRSHDIVLITIADHARRAPRTASVGAPAVCR